MLIKFNDNVHYSLIGTTICTLFVKPNHTLNDILMCKRYVRKQYPKTFFRDTVDIKTLIKES